MLCPKCKKDIPSGAVFCCWCGRRLSPAPRKPKRSPNGTGSAYKRGSGWVAQAVVGYRPLPDDLMDPANAKQRIPIKRTKAGFPSKAEALAYVPILKAGGTLRPETAPALQYYWDSYEKNEYTKLSDSKQTAYSIAWNKLKDIHETQIDQLTVADLRDTVAKACTTYYTAKDCRTVLTNLFRMERIFSEASLVFMASLVISFATTAKPLPASPLLAASIEALRESMLVLLEIF